MNFNERVESIVEAKYLEMLETLQASEDRTGDLLPMLRKLVRALPLIEDIKTEVASIEKKLQPPEPSEEKKEEPQNEDRDQPTLEDQRKVEKLLEYINNLLPKGQQQLLEDNRPGLPTVPGVEIPDSGMDFNMLKWFLRIAQALQDLHDSINQQIVKYMADWKVKEITTLLQGVIWNVKAAEENIRKDIDDGVQDLKEDIASLQSDLSECCQNTSNKLDSISRKIDNLNPQRSANQDLTIIQQGKGIMNDIFNLRGLL